jgi:type 1 fimbria pilin
MLKSISRITLMLGAAFGAAFAPSMASAADGTINITGNIKAATCSVSTASVAVTLPDVAPADFPSVGDTAGSKAFDIGLNCAGSTAQVYMTLTDSTTPANRTDKLTLAPSSTATGVQIQILRSGNTLVSYGPDSNAAGNTNQFLVSSASAIVTAGNVIPFTARYVRTGAVGIGTVSAVATFTMSYQ